MKITVNLIKKYKGYLTEEEKSKSTIEKYVRDVTDFMEWIGYRELSKLQVLDYKKELVEKYTPATVNSILAALNVFFDYNEWYTLLNSVAKLNSHSILSGSTVTNVLIDEQIIKNENNFEKTVKLFETFLKNGEA